MKELELDLKKSFYVSITIHILLFIIFSIVFLKNPFQKIETPTVINIQFNEEIQGNEAQENTQEKSPIINEKKTEQKEVVKQKKISVKEEKNKIKNSETSEKLKEAIAKKEKIEKSISEKKQEKVIPEEGNSKNVKEEENDDLLKNIDEALKTGNSKKAETSTDETKAKDALSGGKWSGKARRTIFFPDIQSKLPDELKKKGIGYSVTAKIKFDKNGLAIGVEIIKSSGNSKVDQIFNTELKKIRVEPSDNNNIDEVIHTFKIQIR